jgi:hypothetical protein
MANDILNTYTIYNNSLNTTTINAITINTNLSEIQHHLYLSGWNPPFDQPPYDDFTGSTTIYQVSRAYVDDISPVTKVFVYRTGTNILLNNRTSIQVGMTVSGDAFTEGQTVTDTSGTAWVEVSDLPDGILAPGDAITFTPDENILIVSSTVGINVGWVATGVGYSGQVVEGFDPPNGLVMSGPPSTQPSGNITFTSNLDNMLEIAPNSSATFVMNYDRVTTVFGTYTSTVKIYATQGSEIVKQVDNFLILSAAPVPAPDSPYYVPSYDGGGDAGSPGPGDCSDAAADSGSSAGCDASAF